MTKNAFDIHEAFASLMGINDRIVWDMYTPEQFPVFFQKLNEIIGMQSTTNSELLAAKDKMRKILVDQVKLQTKYTNKNLLVSFILVTVANGTKHQEAKNATEFSLHLVLRTRKCTNNGNSTNCCMVFIDENGVVYKNWNHFISYNTLPKGIALAPSNGYYTFENEKLNIDSWLTPRNELGPQLLSMPKNLVQMFSRLNNPFDPYKNAINGMTISSILLSGRDRGNLIFDMIKMYHGGYEPASMTVVKAARVMVFFNHSMYNFRLASQLASNDCKLKEINKTERAIHKKFFEETYQTDVIRILNEIPDREFLKDYHSAQRSIVVADMWGILFKKCTPNHSQLTSIIVPMTDRMQFNLASTHPLTVCAFAQTSYDLMDYLTTSLGYKYLPIVDADYLQDCIQYLINYLGEEVTELLLAKTRDFIKNYKGVVEKSVKIKLYVEIVLWDLYKLCEKDATSLLKIPEELQNKMPTLMEDLFFNYERMACSSNTLQKIKCSDCGGFYQEFL